jgi:putative transcriptional regulator
MIICNLSEILGKKKLKVSELCRETGINRGTVDRLYYDTAQRIDLDVVETLCKHLGCTLEELFTIE